MSARRYFSVDEANALVPRLELLFARIMGLRAQLKTLYKELEGLGHPPTIESLQSEKLEKSAPSELRRARGLFKALVETLGEDLAQIEGIGAMVKDAEIGLCDFWSRREGHDVLLCWQFGEKAISFWHSEESGFAGRKPLDASAPAADRTLH